MIDFQFFDEIFQIMLSVYFYVFLTNISIVIKITWDQLFQKNIGFYYIDFNQKNIYCSNHIFICLLNIIL